MASTINADIELANALVDEGVASSHSHAFAMLLGASWAVLGEQGRKEVIDHFTRTYLSK